MRWLVTLLLLVLVLAGGFWLAAGDRIRTAIGISPPNPAQAPSFGLLDQYLKAENIRELKITPLGQGPLTLTRQPDGTWGQPGNWPLREEEVAQLVGTLAGLRSRFGAEPLESDLAKFGLDNDATLVDVSVDVKTEGGSRALKLAFGRPPLAAGESEFARPCFLRIDDQPEVIRLGPDVFPVLARLPEVYRRRQLIPVTERVKLTGGETPDPTRPPIASTARVPLLGDAFTTVKVERTGPAPMSYTLTRTGKTPTPRRDPDRPSAEPSLSANELATAWVLDFDSASNGPGSPTAKIHDRVDPAKLRTILTTIPDLWVESFHPPAPPPTGTIGLDKPERTISISRADGKSIVVQIGNVTRSVTRGEPPPPPMFGAPPMPPKMTTEEYRYAKLKDNDLVFELRTDKLNDLFGDPQEFRDPALARFETAEVAELTVFVKGKPPVKVKRKKGIKDADQEEEKQDRWYVGDALADASKVTELLDQLGRLEARGKDALIDNPSAAKLKELAIDPAAGTRVIVVAQAKVTEGETPPPVRTITFLIGKEETDKKKLDVQIAGWNRVNLVDDSVLKLIDRPALAYRSRRLFDATEVKLATVTVTRDTGDVFGLTLPPKTDGGWGNKWALTRPVQADADEVKSTQFTGDLARLEVTQYVDDAPLPADLEKKYGLTKPRFVVDLAFTGSNAKPQKLEIGAAREGTPEAYARLNGTGSVFTVAKTVVDSLEAGAVSFLPLQLWQTPTDRVTAMAIRRGDGEAYTLTQAGPDWKLTGPFDALAEYSEVLPLLTAAANARADKYVALAADPANHGLDKPALRIAITYKESKPGATDQTPVETVVTKSLLIGKEATPGTRYAKLDGGMTQAVFVISDAIVKAADRPALGWLDRSLLAEDPTKITKLQIAGPVADANVTLTKDDKGIWKAEGATFVVDAPTVDALVATAARPPVSRLAGYGPGVKWADFGLDKPTHTITLTLGGDKPVSHILKLGKAEPSGERYVRIDDGPAVGVIAARTAESLARGRLDFVDHTLLSFEPANLTVVSRKGAGGDLELTQAGFSWEITKPTKQKADRSTIEILIFQIARLRATKVVAFAPADLDKPYGLKSPVATVAFTIGTDKPDTRVLKIGNLVDAGNPDGDRYAAADTPGTPVTVGVIPGQLAKVLLSEPLKFRDRAFAKVPDADKVTLERGDRKLTFTRVGGSWKLTQPLVADAEATELDDLLAALSDLRADELVAEKPSDLKQFGLDVPEAKWKLFAGDKEVFSLLVGAKEKGGPRAFVKLEKGDLVGLVDPILTGRLLNEYRKRAVWSDLDASQAEALEIRDGNATMILRKTPIGWVDPTKPTDPIDAAKVTETLSALAGLKVERFAADKDAKLGLFGLEKPRWVLVVTQRGGAPKTLQLGGPVGGTDGKQVYARLPDQTAVFVLSAADTAKLTRDRAAYVMKK